MYHCPISVWDGTTYTDIVYDDDDNDDNNDDDDDDDDDDATDYKYNEYEERIWHLLWLHIGPTATPLIWMILPSICNSKSAFKLYTYNTVAWWCHDNTNTSHSHIANQTTTTKPKQKRDNETNTQRSIIIVHVWHSTYIVCN